MALLKIEPGVANSSANFTFGNVYSAGYFYANGDPFSGGGGSGTVKYTTATTPPASNNSPGDQWFNTADQVLYEYVNDGVSTYWVDILTPTVAIDQGYSTVTSNGTSNVIVIDSGNINFSVAGSSNVAVFSSTALTLTGNISANNIVGNLTTAEQTNITSVGTLTSLTVSGNATFSSWATFQQSAEVISSLTGATGTVAHDLSTAATFYHSTPSANFTANFTNVSTTNSRAIVTALVVAQGSTPYIPSAVQIDGSAQTVKWAGGTAPSGTASKVEIFSFSLLRVGSAWTVLGQTSNYG